GLGLSEEWSRWGALGWPATPRPAQPAGGPAAVAAERARRRQAVAAAMERAFAEVRDPTRVPGLRAGLAARLQEPDVTGWLDAETTATTADRLCRSLGLGLYVDDPKPAPDTG
uniref:hypothetical protein n=1 Tax=Inquilinus limosus TaxID=171674 RepID=UPI00047A0675